MSRKKITRVQTLMELLDGIPADANGDEEFARFHEIFDYERGKRKKRRAPDKTIDSKKLEA